MASPDSTNLTPGRAPRPWFRFVLVLVPIASLLVLEGIARRVLPGKSAPVVDATVSEALFTGSAEGMRPNARLDLSKYIPGARGMIFTNSLGFRMREFDTKKRAGVYRIVCLGDSVTFGWGVPEEESYPRQLERRLRQRWHRPVEVLNLGIPGARSQRGVILCRTIVPRLSPDLVLIGYGFNDSAYKREVPAASPALRKVRLLLGRFAIYAAIERVAAKLPVHHELPPPKQLGSHGQYRYNNFLMVTGLKKLGAKIILADLDLPNHFASDILDLVGGNQQLPVLHARRLIEGEPQSDEPLPSSEELTETGLLVRCLFEGKGQPSLVGKGAELGDMVPGTIRLHDDGSSGDATPDDDIFSVFVRSAPSTTLDLTFVNPAPQGDWGTPEILGAPAPMSFHVYYRHEVGTAPLMTPVHDLFHWPYERFCVPADPVHLNGEGLSVVAQSLVPIIEQLIETPNRPESFDR